MEYILEGFLLFLTIIIAVRHIYEKVVVRDRIKSKGKIPIPGLAKTDPKMGNLGDLKHHGSIHKFLEHLHNEYGKVVSFYWMDDLVVSICDHEAFKSVKHLFNRHHILFDNFKPFLGEECIQFANGIEGRDRRKCYDQSFTHEALTRYIKVIAEVGNDEIKKIDSSTNMSIESAQVTGLTLAMKSILQACIGTMTKDECFFVKMINLYNVIFDGLTDRLIKEKTFQKEDTEEINFTKIQEEFKSVIKDIVLSRMKYLDEENIKKEDELLIDNIIQFHGEVNFDIIIKDVMVYMIAGFHTSGNLFGWCLFYLAKNPEYQEKIFEEIYQHKVKFYNTKECYNVISNMPFFRAFINETLRLSELSPFATRFSNEDISIGSFFIPANTPIILGLGVSYHDPDIFKDPYIFDPYRFLNKSLPSLSFVPFGFAGKRKCPGENFSYLEVSIWLIQFIRKYRFFLSNPDQEVEKVYGIVTHMDRPVPVIFKSR